MTTPTIDTLGTQRWYNENNDLHRTDGPAIIWADGTQAWLIDGSWHREDGPAYVGLGTENDHHEWYINDKPYFNNKSFQTAAGITDEDMTVIILKYGNVE